MAIFSRNNECQDATGGTVLPNPKVTKNGSWRNRISISFVCVQPGHSQLNRIQSYISLSIQLFSSLAPISTFVLLYCPVTWFVCGSFLRNVILFFIYSWLKKTWLKCFFFTEERTCSGSYCLLHESQKIGGVGSLLDEFLCVYIEHLHPLRNLVSQLVLSNNTITYLFKKYTCSLYSCACIERTSTRKRKYSLCVLLTKLLNLPF